MSRRLSFQSLPFYYGWIIFAITLLIYMFMFGLRYSIGVFFTPIQQEFNWSTAMTASSVTVFFWVYALSAPIVGRLSERIGVRKTVFIGGLLLGGGGTLVSFIQKIWHLYLFWGIIAAIGSAALYIIPTMILSKFFLKKRGRAIGWSSVGVGLGQATLVEDDQPVSIRGPALQRVPEHGRGAGIGLECEAQEAGRAEKARVRSTSRPAWHGSPFQNAISL